ncbi:MAG: hypothetical protein IPJ04_05545 [Candidatus Eisenbacteria bacterium]|nr:hypothetical protein [Candidatus Eisenbacteria bacterium]
MFDDSHSVSPSETTSVGITGLRISVRRRDGRSAANTNGMSSFCAWGSAPPEIST